MTTVRVGFAKTPISDCCNPHVWPVHNDVFGGVIWIDDGSAPALLCPLDHAEMGGHQVDLVKGVLARELRVDPARIVVTFSHTHAVGPMDPLALGARLVATASAARAAARPARVRFVETDVGTAFSVNRRLTVPDLGTLTMTFYRNNFANLDAAARQSGTSAARAAGAARMEVSGQVRDFLRYGVNLYHPGYDRNGPDPARGPAEPSASQVRLINTLPKHLYLDGPVDPLLQALHFEDEQGRAIGTLTRFACHPVVYTGEVISADFPGVLTAELARQTAAPVLFMNGPSGDIKPLIGQNGPAEMERLGRSLALALGPALADDIAAKPAEPLGEFQLARREAWFDLCPDMLHVPASAVDDLARELARAAAQPFEPVTLRRQVEGLLRAWAASPECYGDNLKARMLFSTTVWRFNQIRLVTLPGEMFQAFGAMLRQQFAGQPLMVTELADTDRTGYVPTRADFATGGYEVAASCLEPGSGEKLTAMAAALLQETGLQPK